MSNGKNRTAEQLRGQLMLQLSAGKYFRPDVELNERPHRRTFYTNAWTAGMSTLDLPVGRFIAATDSDDISTVLIEAVDRLEATTWDGTSEFMVATGGTELVDDVAYVATFVLDRTFSPSHDEVHRLVPAPGATGRRAGAASLFPGLFQPGRVITSDGLDHLKQFMKDLIDLSRDDFARVMLVIRSSVDATRRALDDPTGAYTDLVATLESLADDKLTTADTWNRYDSRKKKIFDQALAGRPDDLVKAMHAAILNADRAGLTRRFVASTLARVTPDYYRADAVGTEQPPRSADLERMLKLAYRIRSRRTHLLEDLGQAAWAFTDGAETTHDLRFRSILTLCGLWRLIRHVVRQYVATAPKVSPEPWDYRHALPGIAVYQLAPQYWIGHPGVLDDPTTALARFNGVVEAVIAWRSGTTDEGFNLTEVIDGLETLVPAMPVGDPRTALVGIHVLWHELIDPADHRSHAAAFRREYETCLDVPSPIAFTVAVLCQRDVASWTPDQWIALANSRRAARLQNEGPSLPATIDTLLQLETADQLEAAGRHEEAVVFASYAVEESPGVPTVLKWEQRLIEGNHDPNFDVNEFLYGTPRDG